MVNRKSTNSDAQRIRIVEALRIRPYTSYELRRLGCYQCPARILELRRSGYEIATDPVTVVDAEGYSHAGVALYTLLAEPQKKEGTDATKK